MHIDDSINDLFSKPLIRAAALKERIENLTRDLEHILDGTGIATTSKAKAARRDSEYRALLSSKLNT